MQARSIRKATSSISKNLSLASIFGALYAALVIVFGLTSFQPFQIRFADALLPLAVLFGWPAALGLAIGAAVANFAGSALGFGIPSSFVWLDIIGGGIANLLAGLAAWKIGIRKWLPTRAMWFLATVPETVIVSIIVGGYLSVVFPNAFEISILSVAIGSIAAINVIGYLLLRVVGRPATLQSLVARGLVVYTPDPENSR